MFHSLPNHPLTLANYPTQGCPPTSRARPHNFGGHLTNPTSTPIIRFPRIKKPPLAAVIARDRSRTCKTFRSLAPQASASANFATRADFPIIAQKNHFPQAPFPHAPYRLVRRRPLVPNGERRSVMPSAHCLYSSVKQIYSAPAAPRAAPGLCQLTDIKENDMKRQCHSPAFLTAHFPRTGPLSDDPLCTFSPTGGPAPSRLREFVPPEAPFLPPEPTFLPRQGPFPAPLPAIVVPQPLLAPSLHYSSRDK
jgi:hypothetical protein